MNQPFDRVLDARGLNCPMPLVNARKEIARLSPGQVLKVPQLLFHCLHRRRAHVHSRVDAAVHNPPPQAVRLT